METIYLLGSTMGLGFVSGLNLYATVLAVGLGIRFGIIHPYPGIAHLEVLTNPYILIAAGTVYVIEFFADKIPWVDSLWDAFHTLIRPIGAAILGVTAVGSVDPSIKLATMLLCGGVAFSGHSAKAGTRVAVNHSPEPFTNIGLSVIEDFVAVVGTWLALMHPAVMLIAVLAFLAVFLWLSPKIFRLIRLEVNAVIALIGKYWFHGQTYLAGTGTGPNVQISIDDRADIGLASNIIADTMPEKYSDFWKSKHQGQEAMFCIKCVAGKGMKGIRNSIGYLHLTDNGLIFITRRSFRFRSHLVDLNIVEEVQFKSGILLDRIFWKNGKKQEVFLFFKHKLNRNQEVFNLLKRK